MRVPIRRAEAPERLPLRQRVRHWLVRGLFRGLLALLRVTPWPPALACGSALGAGACRLSGRYRGVADRNLRLAYGDDLTPAERRRLTQDVFRHFGRALLIEFLKVPSLSPAQVRALVPIQPSELNPLTQALARGRGVIVVSAHLGNWELLVRRIALEGVRVLVVARQGRDPAFNALTDRLRENGGYQVHSRDSSPRPLLRHLQSGGVVAILCDQKSDAVFVPFFGHTAGTTDGPAVLALRTGAAVLPLFAPRGPDGKYRPLFLPEIDTHATGNRRADAARIMGDITAGIEEVVRRYPDQWLWMHDRWRLPAEFRTPQAQQVQESSPAL